MRVNTIIVLLIALILAMPQQAFSLRPTNVAVSEENKSWLEFWDNHVDTGLPEQRIYDISFSNIILENIPESSRILTIGEGASIMDVGGILFMDQLSKKCRSALATDFSAEKVELLKSQREKYRLEEVLDVRQLDISRDFDLPGKFDAVISHLSLGMYSSDEEFLEILGRIKNVINENKQSRLILQVRTTDDYLYGRGKRIGPDTFVKPHPRTGQDYIRHFWTEKSMREILHQAGFEVEKMTSYKRRIYTTFDKFSLLTVVAKLSSLSHQVKFSSGGKAIGAIMPSLEPTMVGAKPVLPVKSISIQSAIKRSA